MTSAPDLSDLNAHRKFLREITQVYDSRIVRWYCAARFQIININILHILSLSLDGCESILEVGCGFGLFGCYFARRYPWMSYHGIDLDAGRIAMARRAAERLGLRNVRFDVGDARQSLSLAPAYDAALMMDLMHHIPDEAKHALIGQIAPRIAPDGRIVIKDVSRTPAWKLFFTWALDVAMTRGFDMWYWGPEQFRRALGPSFTVEAFPISDILPYPHILYRCEKRAGG